MAHAFLATVLAEQGEHAASRVEAAKARALAFPDTDWLEDIDKMNTRELRKALLWQIPLACLAVMAAVLLLLYLAGTALSGAQFGSLASLHPHMLRGEQTPRERFVLRLYLGVLWFGTIFFYVSVPAMVLLSLAVGVGLAYLILTNLSHIPLKVVAIVVIAGLGGVWAVLRGLFLPASAETSGKEITSSDEPGLFAALGEVAEVAGTRRVDRVYLELGAEAAVRESGGAWRVLLGRGERVLHLGFWTLQGLTITELKAILAHEYGHFSHGETRLTPVVSRIVNTVVGMLRRMVALGRSTWVNPVYWYLRIYFHVFLVASAGHSRRRELLADRAAALGYGGDAFGSALRKVIENDAYFGQKAGAIAVLLRLRGNPCTAIYRALQAGNALVPAKLLATILQSRIDARLAAENKVAKDVPMDPGAQVLFAEGLQLHDAALGLQELEDPEADGMLAAAVERLQAALGAKDPILIGALKNLARTQHRLGRKAEAEATLSRALDILAEHPDEQEARNVRGMMTELAAA